MTAETTTLRLSEDCRGEHHGACARINPAQPASYYPVLPTALAAEVLARWEREEPDKGPAIEGTRYRVCDCWCHDGPIPRAWYGNFEVRGCAYEDVVYDESDGPRPVESYPLNVPHAEWPEGFAPEFYGVYEGSGPEQVHVVDAPSIETAQRIAAALAAVEEAAEYVVRVRWSPDDILGGTPEGRRFTGTREQATEWLAGNHSGIEDAMVIAGWEAIESLSFDDDAWGDAAPEDCDDPDCEHNHGDAMFCDLCERWVTDAEETCPGPTGDAGHAVDFTCPACTLDFPNAEQLAAHIAEEKVTRGEQQYL